MKDFYKSQTISHLARAIDWFSHATYDEKHGMFDQLYEDLRRTKDCINKAIKDIEKYEKKVLPF